MGSFEDAALRAGQEKTLILACDVSPRQPPQRHLKVFAESPDASCISLVFVLKFARIFAADRRVQKLGDNHITTTLIGGGSILKISTTLAFGAAVAVVGLTIPAAMAQAPNNDGHLFDTRGTIAKSGFGLCWKTARWTPAMALAECDPDLVKKPEPPAKAAEPAKSAVPAAPAAPKKCDFTYALQSDATFAFGKAELNAAGKDQLDKNVLAKLVACATVKLLLVTGHTDRIGAHQGNQKLSEKRAEAVKAYLASKGVKGDGIETMGAGKTQAVPGVKCDDKLPRQKLIDCLAPNRRVVIEAQGPAK
jgi:OOP family OmpA-OmpF porin